jgi:hypothetical protein
MMRTTVIVCAALVMCARHAHGDSELGEQGSVDIPFDRSQLSLAMRGTSPSTLDAGGSYRDASVAVDGALSLYSRLHVSAQDVSMLRVLAQFRIEGERVEADMFASDRQILKTSLGATAIYLSPARNLYMVYGGAAIAQGAGTFDHLSLMPTVLGLGTVSAGQTRWLYGGGFGYVFGRGWVLPMAGVIWPIADDWTLTTLLPMFADLRHTFSSTISGDVLLAANADRFDFANDGDFATTSTHLQLRLVQLKLCVGVTYRWSPSWSLRGELGVLAPRKLDVVDDGTQVMSGRTPGAGYLSATMRYTFGNAPL